MLFYRFQHIEIHAALKLLYSRLPQGWRDHVGFVSAELAPSCTTVSMPVTAAISNHHDSNTLPVILSCPAYSEDGRHALSYELSWRRLAAPKRAASRAVLSQLGDSLKSAIKYTFREDTVGGLLLCNVVRELSSHYTDCL